MPDRKAKGYAKIILILALILITRQNEKQQAYGVLSKYTIFIDTWHTKCRGVMAHSGLRAKHTRIRRRHFSDAKGRFCKIVNCRPRLWKKFVDDTLEVIKKEVSRSSQSIWVRSTPQEA